MLFFSRAPDPLSPLGRGSRVLFVVTSALALGYLHFVSRENVLLHFAVELCSPSDICAFSETCIPTGGSM
jgi:hypothetical protein